MIKVAERTNPRLRMQPAHQSLEVAFWLQLLVPVVALRFVEIRAGHLQLLADSKQGLVHGDEHRMLHGSYHAQLFSYNTGCLHESDCFRGAYA